MQSPLSESASKISELTEKADCDHTITVRFSVQNPLFTVILILRQAYCTLYAGLLAYDSNARILLPGFPVDRLTDLNRTRQSQWRDRAGLQPASLLAAQLRAEHIIIFIFGEYAFISGLLLKICPAYSVLYLNYRDSIV